MNVDMELLKCAVTLGILFFVLSHPLLYRFLHRQFYTVMAFVNESMCPTEGGVFVHALVFILVVYFGKQLLDKHVNPQNNNNNNRNNLLNNKSNNPKDKAIRKKCRVYCQQINNEMNNQEQANAPAMNQANMMNNLTGQGNNNQQANYGHDMNSLNNNINMNHNNNNMNHQMNHNNMNHNNNNMNQMNNNMNQMNNNMNNNNNVNYDDMMVNTVNSLGNNMNNMNNNMMNEPSACSMNNNFTNQLGGNDFLGNSSPVDDMFAAF